jgi:hypothetical protein
MFAAAAQPPYANFGHVEADEDAICRSGTQRRAVAIAGRQSNVAKPDRLDEGMRQADDGVDAKASNTWSFSRLAPSGKNIPQLGATACPNGATFVADLHV